tara:strand:+ start:118 stop:858 length:741 start_codon:yes stop_codon:yes gene_type:complete
MTNQISSPYADFIQEQKKLQREQKYLKKIDVSMIASYHIAYYETIIKLRKSTINTLEKNKGKILNKNILEKINIDIRKVLPYSEFGLTAYHQKPESKTEENRIYFYCHHQNNYFNIDKFVCDVIISESAKDRKSEKILKSEKIDYQVIHNLNVRRFADNIQELKKWVKIKSSSYDIQYRIDQINSLKNELDNFIKLFDESEGYKHKNYTIMELIEDNAKHSDRMVSWLSKQNEYLISYDEFRKQNK